MSGLADRFKKTDPWGREREHRLEADRRLEAARRIKEVERKEALREASSKWEREREAEKISEAEARIEERQKHPEIMKRDAEVWREFYVAALRGGGNQDPRGAATCGLSLYRKVVGGLV